MKAIGLMEFGTPDVLKSLSMDIPSCGNDQVLIRVEGVSVNYADLQTRRGTYHAGGTIFPVIPGLDAVGIVEEIGSHVTHLRTGQRVLAFPHTGTYAEYVVSDANLTFSIPDGLSLEQAIACPLVTFTSRMLLEKVAQIQPDESLLIHAASGGIGTTVIQTARSMGVKKIIGTVGSKQKKQAVLDAGADHVICLADEDFAVKAAALTEGKGVDVILDSLGGNYTILGMDCLCPYGRMVVFGNASGAYSSMNTGLLHASCRSLRGFSIGSTRKQRPAWFADIAPAVMQDLSTGKIRIPIAAAFPMEEAAKAHALLEERGITGKIILRVI